MVSISLCMIVKNEEDTLERCLNSVKDLVDEIIIVDTGSTDKTKEIAQKFTDKIYDFEWCDDFSKARNYSFSKATKDYILWLDADDVLLEKDRQNFKLLKENFDSKIDIVMFKYNLDVDKNGIPALSYYRERLLRRKNNYKWVSPVHEAIAPTGYVYKSDICVTHKKIHKSDPKRNLNIFNKMIEKNIQLDARQTFYYARELYYNKEYEKSITEYNKFLNGEDGWIENKITACLDLYNLYNLLGKEDMAFESLIKALKYDIPRAEFCCAMGNYFLQKNLIDIAIYWFLQAKEQKYDISKGGFFNKDAYDYIPYISLCVCYYKLKDYKKSKEYNNLAGQVKPDSEAYLYNVQFFKSMGI